MDAPLDPFLDALGEDAIYTPAGGAPVQVRLIFHVSPGALDLGGGIEPPARQIVVTVRHEDVPGLKMKDRFTVRGVEYVVQKPDVDETGAATVVLVKGY